MNMIVDNYSPNEEMFDNNFFTFFNNVMNSVSSNNVSTFISQGLFPTVNGTTVSVSPGDCQGIDVFLSFLNNGIGARVPTPMEQISIANLSPLDGFNGYAVAQLSVTPTSVGSAQYIFTTTVLLVESPTVVFPSGNVCGEVVLASVARTGSSVTVDVTAGAKRISYSNPDSSIATAIAGGAANNILVQSAPNVTGFLATVNNALLITDSSGNVQWSTFIPNSYTTATASKTASTIMLRDASINSQINSLIEGFLSQAGGSTITLAVGSAPYIQITGSGATTVNLPNATTLAANQDYTIYNNSTGVVTINNASSSTVATLNPGYSVVLRVTDISTTAGVWNAIYNSLSSSGSGILPIAQGGTNSGTALANGKIMGSVAGSIVETSLPISGYTAYNASTNTPAINTMTAGQVFTVTATGRITGVSIVGAVVGSDSFVFAGDQIYYNGSTYQLVNQLIPPVTFTVKIGVLNNSTGIYFTSLNENNTYLNQRRFSTTGINTLFDTSYDGTEPVDQINIQHIDGIRWFIQGNVIATTTITALASTSGTVGNQSPVYTLSSATGFAVGQVVNIDAETAVDNATTDTLGCNSGAFQITGLSGTAMTVNNCNTMKDVLVPSDFSGATATVVTTIKARIRITAPGLIIANINHLNDNATTSPIVYVRESTILFTGIWSAATTNASTLSVAVAQFNNSKIADSTYDADGIPQTAKLIISGKTSSSGNLLDQFNNSTISVAELIGPGVLSFYSSNVLTQSIFSPVNTWTSNVYLSGNLFTNNAPTGIANGIQGLGSNIEGLGLHVCNNNHANGAAVQGGYLKVTTQQCNNNGSFGNLSTSGSIFIGTQLNCNGNVSANFSAQQGGFIQITTLTNSISSGTNMISSGGGTINVTTMPSASTAYTGILNVSKGSKILVANQANWTLNTGTFGIQNTDASFIG